MMLSVCIATHNGEKFIYEQILSILSQIKSSDEVVISDDNSTDKTIEIIKNFNDPRIKLYNNNFKSPIKNFEFLIDNCNGDLIFLSDQDDIWARKKVKMHLDEYNKNQSTGLVISDIQLIDKNGVSIDKKFFIKKFSSNWINNIFSNNYIGCSISFRSSLKNFILPFPKNLPMHDWWIGVIASLFSNVIYINEKLVFYRIHEHNFTLKNKYSLLKKIQMRVRICFYALIRTLKFKF
jgi:glycosyltransferase involved in cell wall biosynthesis